MADTNPSSSIKKVVPQNIPLRVVSYTLLLLCSLGPIFFLYDLAFPDVPLLVPRKGSDALLREIFYSGNPAIVLCENRTSGLSLDKIGPSINQAARAVSGKSGAGLVKTYRVDCSSEAPINPDATVKSDSDSEKDIYQKFGINKWVPAYFVVGNGMRPSQLSPMNSLDPLELEKEVRRSGMLFTKYTRIDDDHDFDKCLKERTGGCVLLYTSREGREVAAEIEGSVEKHRTVLFATLLASTRHFASDNDALKTLVKGTSTKAKEAAAASGIENAKGTVIIYAKRVPSSLNNGVSGAILVTVRAASAPSSLADADIELAILDNKAAFAKLKAIDEASQAALAKGVTPGDLADLLLARDEELAQMNASVVGRGEVRISQARARFDSSGGAGGFEGEEDKFADQLSRREARAAKRERETQERERQEAALTPEQRAQRERERRQEMAKEEKENAHIAMEAMEDEDVSNDSAEGDEESIEDVDLDDDADL
jgi:hypothetical protein